MCDSIMFIFSFSISSDRFSSIFVVINRILSSGFINSVRSDSGNIISDISGTNIRFVMGDIIFIS